MKRGLIVLLVALVVISVSGCTMNDLMGVRQEQKAERYEPKPELTSHENYSLQTWDRAASMADDVGDYTTAIQYYTKIIDYFPETAEGIKAKKRLNELNARTKKARQEIVEENK